MLSLFLLYFLFSLLLFLSQSLFLLLPAALLSHVPSLVEDVRVKWQHVIPCGTVGSMSSLQEQDRLGHACCEARADSASAHGDSTVKAGVDPDDAPVISMVAIFLTFCACTGKA